MCPDGPQVEITGSYPVVVLRVLLECSNCCVWHV